MTNKKHLGEILTEQDLVLAWKHMLRENKHTCRSRSQRIRIWAD